MVGSGASVRRSRRSGPRWPGRSIPNTRSCKESTDRSSRPGAGYRVRAAAPEEGPRARRRRRRGRCGAAMTEPSPAAKSDRSSISVVISRAAAKSLRRRRTHSTRRCSRRPTSDREHASSALERWDARSASALRSTSSGYKRPASYRPRDRDVGARAKQFPAEPIVVSAMSDLRQPNMSRSRGRPRTRYRPRRSPSRRRPAFSKTRTEAPWLGRTWQPVARGSIGRTRARRGAAPLPSRNHDPSSPVESCIPTRHSVDRTCGPHRRGPDDLIAA
jgi:hypothetical protein